MSVAELGLGTTAAVRDDPITAVGELAHSDLNRAPLADAAFAAAGVAEPLSYDHEAVSRMLRARTGFSAVGEHEIRVVRDITTAFVAADEQLGGGHGLTTVAAYLADTAVPMLRARFPSEALRRDAFAAAAELAYLLGWKHHDLGHPGTAQRYYLTGYVLAHESDQPHTRHG